MGRSLQPRRLHPSLALAASRKHVYAHSRTRDEPHTCASTRLVRSAVASIHRVGHCCLPETLAPAPSSTSIKHISVVISANPGEPQEMQCRRHLVASAASPECRVPVTRTVPLLLSTRPSLWCSGAGGNGGGRPASPRPAPAGGDPGGSVSQGTKKAEPHLLGAWGPPLAVVIVLVIRTVLVAGAWALAWAWASAVEGHIKDQAGHRAGHLADHRARSMRAVHRAGHLLYGREHGQEP